jgi:hypothetical protein
VFHTIDSMLICKKDKLYYLLLFLQPILSIYNKESINKLVEHVKSIKSSYPGFELKNYVGNKALNDKNEPIDPVYYLWLPLLDMFRTLNWSKIKSELQFSGMLSTFSMLQDF